MDSEEVEEDGWMNFPGFSGDLSTSRSTFIENRRLRGEVDRLTRQMEMILAHEEGRKESKMQTHFQMKSLSTFSGKDSKVSVNDWTRDVSFLIRTSCLENDNRAAVELIERYVTGQAAKVFRAEVNKGKTYEEILKRMQIIFGGIEYNGRDPLQLFYCRVQRENETPLEYAIELSELLGVAEREGNDGEIYPNRDKMLKDVLMGGLLDERIIMQIRPLVAMELSFEEIQDELLKLEYDRKRQDKKVTNQIPTSTWGRGPKANEDPTLRAIKEMKMEFKEELSKLNAKLEAQAAEVRDLKRRVVSQVPIPTPVSTKSETQGDARGRACYTCGKVGHLAFNCPERLAQRGAGGGGDIDPTNKTQRNVEKPEGRSGESVNMKQGGTSNSHRL